MSSTMTTPIGFFDSGLGGLGVYKEIQKLKPCINSYYISDLAYSPYGEKSQEEILQRCKSLTETLLSKGVGSIVVACNTATALSIDELRKSYPVPFVGVEPYLNFIHKAKEQGLSPLRPVVLLTKASAQSQRFQSLREKLGVEGLVDVFPCEGLANLVESSLPKRKEEAFANKLAEILGPLKGKGYTHAILGCTHYPFISREIEKFLDLTCLSPESHVALRVLDQLKQALPLSSESGPALPLKLPLVFSPVKPGLHLAVTREDPDLAAKLHCIFHELP